MLYFGPVRAPQDARPGPAVIRCRLPENAGHVSTPTDIPVEIEAPPEGSDDG